jgi:methylenetetrahydrofolate dehydrogenase (NADP+)/methenyltetrahydrofolate cyclohydrolase
MSSPIILDGKKTSQQVLDQTAARVERVIKASGVTPCLAAIIVGADPASQTYVRMKVRRCEGVGMKSIKVELPEETTTAELVKKIEQLGKDKSVHGILLQHPVPSQIDERAGFEAIKPIKDVDGVTMQSFGAISLGAGEYGYGSCTPAGIMRLMHAYDIPIKGKHAVVVGRSPILGKPMAMMLLAEHATVTICHSRTVNLPDIVRQGDIVVAAVGKPAFVQGDWIKQGAVVIDAGYTQGNIGDVDYDAASQRASHITPVPGGVGPMTIAMLLEQTVEGCVRQIGLTDV